MPRAQNILFIMCDQLRFDYLSRYGHPHLHTPHLDGLAARGVCFTRAYVQSPVCGPSRMSFYTGRYMRSHGSSWNNVPLKLGELTMGDHLRPLGVRTALVGKTHMQADLEGMARLGIDPRSTIGVHLAECGFEPFERDDGLHGTGPEGSYDPKPFRYNQYLAELGYDGPNPWDDWANAAEGEGGEILSGWLLKHNARAARVRAEHAESPYMTDRAMAFIEEAGDAPWCLHLSYIKPHWPCIAPAPYHALYGTAHILPVVRSNAERDHPHPVLGAFMAHRAAQAFSREEVRQAVIPAYMGLIKQIDDEMGRLFAFLEARGLFTNTMIVFTSDHGDYLGDHWLGEKDLFHDPSAKVPLIIYDPRPAADATRGTTADLLVEAIDLLPTFMAFCGGEPPMHILEGRSLLPILEGRQDRSAWRDAAFSEYDYGFLPARQALGRAIGEAYLAMVATERWKYIHAEGFRPMLFDLQSDPQELVDLGEDSATAAIRADLEAKLHAWTRRRSQRTTISDITIQARAGQSLRQGVFIGYWDESELPKGLWPRWR